MYTNRHAPQFEEPSICEAGLGFQAISAKQALRQSLTRSGTSSIRIAALGRLTSKSGPSAGRGNQKRQEPVTDLRIFSYLPNPRIWKATIAARLCGVEIELRGTRPDELKDWLWDFDARPVSEAAPDAAASAERIGRVGFKGGRLFKTDAFLSAHPFGTVPAAFSPDGQTGIFESNSIMRAVARLGAGRFPLYGRDPYQASRIGSFLDASLVFARDSQTYLLTLLALSTSPRAIEPSSPEVPK